MASVTLYWLEKSRAHRILWLLEELRIDYNVKTYKRVKMLAPEELKQIHPLGKSPIITVESAGKRVVLAESGAIIEYLIDHFGPHLAPSRYPDGGPEGVGLETESWLRYRYIMHYTEGSLMPYLVTILLMSGVKTQSPFFIRPLARVIAGAVESNYTTPNLKTQFDFLEDKLTTSPDNGQFICGPSLTGADILLVFPLGAAVRAGMGLTKESHPQICAYVDRLESTDSFKRAVQKIVDIDGTYNANL